jgi:hypothetical protein
MRGIATSGSCFTKGYYLATPFSQTLDSILRAGSLPK